MDSPTPTPTAGIGRAAAIGLLMVVAGAAGFLGTQLIPDPFEHFSGEFEGEANGQEIWMEVERHPRGRVLASVQLREDPETTMSLEGEISGRTVTLNYRRPPGHLLGPDEAIVVLEPTDDGTIFEGDWFSDAKVREPWTIKRVPGE